MGIGGGAVSIDSSGGGIDVVVRFTVAYERTEGVARRASCRVASIVWSVRKQGRESRDGKRNRLGLSHAKVPLRVSPLASHTAHGTTGELWQTKWSRQNRPRSAWSSGNPPGSRSVSRSSRSSSLLSLDFDADRLSSQVEHGQIERKEPQQTGQTYNMWYHKWARPCFFRFPPFDLRLALTRAAVLRP